MTFVLSGNLRRFVSFQHEVEARGSTLGECFEDLVVRHPQLRPVLLDGEGRVRRVTRVFLNGNQLESAEPTIPVSANDCVSLLTAIAGG